MRPSRGGLGQLLLVTIQATALLALVCRHLRPLALFSTGHRYLKSSMNASEWSETGAVNLITKSLFVKDLGGKKGDFRGISGIHGILPGHMKIPCG